METIKEAVYQVFSEATEKEAEATSEHLGKWIRDAGIPDLKRWYANLSRKWGHVAAYYRSSTTSALSEGVNNVIKSIKRRAFGYRNMGYFKLKIMQVCGHLKSKVQENQPIGA
jgi:transposase